MGKYTFSAALLIALFSHAALAQNASEEVITKSFFSSGGPAAEAKPAALPNPATFSPDPVTDQNPRQHAIDTSSPNVSHNGARIPNPALFTPERPADQVREHAFNLFGTGNKAKAASARSLNQPLVVNGQINDMPPPLAGSNTTMSALPDASLFTETGKKDDQVREHPIKLF